MAGLLQALGSPPREIRITRLAGDTFYASVMLDGPSGSKSVDARPSDALNLALATSVPVRVEAALLQSATAPATRDPSGPPGRFTEGRAEIVADLRAKMARERLPEP